MQTTTVHLGFNHIRKPEEVVDGLGDIADCCIDAQEIIAKLQRVCPDDMFHAVSQQFQSLHDTLHSMRGEVHRAMYPNGTVIAMTPHLMLSETFASFLRMGESSPQKVC